MEENVYGRTSTKEIKTTIDSKATTLKTAQQSDIPSKAVKADGIFVCVVQDTS